MQSFVPAGCLNLTRFDQASSNKTFASFRSDGNGLAGVHLEFRARTFLRQWLLLEKTLTKEAAKNVTQVEQNRTTARAFEAEPNHQYKHRQLARQEI